ncbi:MAG: cytochrome c oxidase subunit II [Gemmatimonadota bacterium]
MSLFALTALGGCASEEYPQTTFQPVTGFGRIIDNLFHGVFWWTMLVLLVVFVVLGYVLIRFRERPDSPDPKPVYGNTVLEITWTVIPALIIVAILIPTIRGIFETQRAAPKDALVVEVIGHQWWWEFKYPSLGITTASQLVLPVGRPLDLRLHSADVIHSFWIPRLGGKRDVNPVRQMPNGEKPPHLNHISLTVDSVGEYPGQCAEFCGTEHGAMRMLAIAVPPSEFDAWAQRMKAGQDTAALSAPQDSLALRGKKKFDPPCPPDQTRHHHARRPGGCGRHAADGVVGIGCARSGGIPVEPERRRGAQAEDGVGHRHHGGALIEQRA